MEVVNIKNSKLRLVVLHEGSDYSGGSYPKLPNKKALRYQIAVMVATRPSTKVWISKTYDQNCIMRTVGTNLIILLERTKKEWSDSIQYEPDQQRYLMMALSGFFLGWPGVSEALALATEKKYVIEGYYKNAGWEMSEEFKAGLARIIDSEDDYILSLDNADMSKYAKYNPRSRRYSIMSLVHDLVQDHAFIIPDDDLIKYNRITPEQIYKDPGFSKMSAFPITGIQGNKKRANISLTYEIPVKLPLPMNPYFTTTEIETKMTRNYCVLLDSRPNGRYLAVRCSGKLIGKLKRLGVFEMNLVHEGEYLLNISKLPSITPAKCRPISAYSLGYLELESQKYDIAIKYAIDLEGTTKLEPADKFLEDLGVKDGCYHPKTDGYKKSTPYFSLGIETKSTLNTTGRKVQAAIIEWKKYGNCSEPYQSIFQEIQDKASELGVSEVRIKLEKTKRKLDHEIAKKKFSLIALKKVSFPDRSFSRGFTYTSLPGDPVKITWAWSKIKNYKA